MGHDLRFSSADLGYGQDVVLPGVDLVVPAGTFVAIHGPSGGGKSTLLLASLGLIAPLAGSVDTEARSRAWVPQQDRLDRLHPVSVDELILQGVPMNQRRWGRPSRAARASANACLERLGLEGLGPSPFARLSGGQRQRALVARALCARGEIIALDEPTSALDEESAGRVQEAVAAEAEAGRTVLYVTHDPSGLEGLADMTVNVSAGQVTVSNARPGAPRASSIAAESR